MSCGLTTGRAEPCSDNIGGLRKVYLFNYTNYNQTQITGGLDGDAVTTYPATTIYEFPVFGASFNENITQDEQGYKYSQSLNFRLKKIGFTTNIDLDIATRRDIGFIVEFNDGTFRIGGLWNGARVQNLEINTGGAKGDFNGYDITIVADEIHPAPEITDLSSAGFTVSGVLLLENPNELLMQNSFTITLE